MTSMSTRRTYEGSTKEGVASGVSVFAGVMLCTVAAFEALEGLAAILDDDVFVRGLNYTYEVDLTTWGWVHLVMGIIGVLTGIGILLGQIWGRIVGIAIAALVALANFAFIPYYPFWSITIIAFNGFVIWALCTQLTYDEVD